MFIKDLSILIEWLLCLAFQLGVKERARSFIRGGWLNGCTTITEHDANGFTFRYESKDLPSKIGMVKVRVAFYEFLKAKEPALCISSL